MRKVKDAVDLGSGEKIYFRGHAQATYMSDGRTVEEAVNQGGGGGSYDDTGIKKDISDLKANDALQDTKLAKLSGEVSVLSERVDNLPTAKSLVFKAEYGVTTYEEIKAAYDSGKVVHCDYDSYCYVLVRIASFGAYFVCLYSHNAQRIVCGPSSNWSKAILVIEDTANKTTSLSSASTDTQYPSAKAVYDALQNVGGGGSGMTTPSGDPMHYMYEAVGAEWNGTGADMERQGIYGDTITHKAGYWYLNELGDITTEEMMEVYVKSANLCNMVGLDRALASTKIRTNIPIIDRELPLMGALARMEQNMGCFAANSKCETICIFSPSIPMTSATIKEYNLKEGNGMFFGCSKLKKVLNVLPISKMSSVHRLLWEAPVLEEIRANGLKTSIEVKHSPVLSNASILYMIENEAATSAIAITLHADAYARAMADAEITAALEAHPNVSLASA